MDTKGVAVASWCFPPKPRQIIGGAFSPVMLLATGLSVLDTQTLKRSGAGGIPAPLVERQYGIS